MPQACEVSSWKERTRFQRFVSCRATGQYHLPLCVILLCQFLRWSDTIIYIFLFSFTCSAISSREVDPSLVFFVCCCCYYCQRGNRAKKRGYLGGRFIIPHDVGKNSQILRNPLKFAFFVFITRGPKLGDSVGSCSLSVQEDLTGEQALIRFLVWKGN